MSILEVVPTAIHRGAAELPWVDIGGGNLLRVMHVNEKMGLRVTETTLRAGYEAPIHRHTGPVWAYTTSGAWCYAESDFVNRAGSYLYEPAGSTHTLQCMEDDTHTVFVTLGAVLYLDEDGAVSSVVDGPSVLAAYYRLCEQAGLPKPDVVIE